MTIDELTATVPHSPLRNRQCNPQSPIPNRQSPIANRQCNHQSPIANPQCSPSRPLWSSARRRAPGTGARRCPAP
ncbi:MAG: hypothetical protein FJW23_06790 [Acidimicrobiia bacterium]|nr:hypothetical protein [Acidimicrobiia bacterium]